MIGRAWVYILRCADGTYYLGSTTDPRLRLGEHQAGLSGKYTSARRPVRLVFAAECTDIQEAYDRERQIKGWSRAKKEAVIAGNFEALPGLAHPGAVPSTSSGNAAEVPRRPQPESVTGAISPAVPSTGSGNAAGRPRHADGGMATDTRNQAVPSTGSGNAAGRPRRPGGDTATDARNRGADTGEAARL